VNLSMGERVAAVVLAGGSGSRFGAAVSKVYVQLDGRPILAYALAVLHASPVVDDVVVVIREGDQSAWEAVAAKEPTDRVRAVVTGGDTRQRSEWAGISAIRDHVPDVDVVLLHDAARPFLTHGLVAQLVTPVATDVGAVPGLPVHGGLRDLDGRPVGVGDLIAVQTPQAFSLAALVTAYPAAIDAGFDGVDTAQTVQAHADVDVRWVRGDPRNLKITHPPDLDRAGALLPSWRDGRWAT
jgi:2-C-methyl-D-erythritol 4-phosphate cytidylyltransferase